MNLEKEKKITICTIDICASLIIYYEVKINTTSVHKARNPYEDSSIVTVDGSYRNLIPVVARVVICMCACNLYIL